MVIPQETCRGSVQIVPAAPTLDKRISSVREFQACAAMAWTYGERKMLVP